MRRNLSSEIGQSTTSNGTKQFKPVEVDPTQMFATPRPMAAPSSVLVSQQKPAPSVDDGICSEVVVMHRPVHPDLVSDMSQSFLSTRGVRYVVCDCDKRKIFPLVKFFDKEDHYQFSKQMDTVCGIVLHFANMTHNFEARDWWTRTRQLVHNTHTIHRNNCIKNMRKAFIGKSKHAALFACANY